MLEPTCTRNIQHKPIRHSVSDLGTSLLQSAIFLDRDGVIVENREDYVKSWGEVSFLPGALGALSTMAASPRAIVMVTNQSVVGRGIITLNEALAINQRVVEQIERHGGRIDASYICPHHPDARCACRKPEPGLLFQAQTELRLDLSRSYLVGDATTDMDAACAAGVQGILVLTGRGCDQASRLIPSGRCPVVVDLEAALRTIQAREKAD